MRPAPQVVVCGSLHLDVVVRASRLPELDETAVGSARSFKCGGKGGNQAVMAARLGAATAMIGRVGGDAFGDMLLGNLDQAGVDRRAVAVDGEASSGMSVAIVVPDGNYGAVIVSGANLDLEPVSVGRALREAEGARVLLLQNEVPEPVNLAAAGAARALGLRVVLNAAPARPMSEALLALVNLLVVNRVEAEALAGSDVREPEQAAAAARALGRGARDVVVTLGAAGLVVAPRGAVPSFVPARAVAAVSAHGAGDCFLGALAARLARGDELSRACRWASTAASLYVSLDAAAQVGMRAEDVEALLG